MVYLKVFFWHLEVLAKKLLLLNILGIFCPKNLLSRFCLSLNAKISNCVLQITDFYTLMSFCGEGEIRTRG